MRSMPHQRYWSNLLGIGDYMIIYLRVSHNGITDENIPDGHKTKLIVDGVPARIIPMSIVAGEIDHDAHVVQISHSRKIGELEFLHEVVEGLNRYMSHDEIDPLCEKLIAARKVGSPIGLIHYHRLGLRKSS